MNDTTVHRVPHLTRHEIELLFHGLDRLDPGQGYTDGAGTFMPGEIRAIGASLHTALREALHGSDDEGFFEHAKREMMPKLADSALSVALCPTDPDPDGLPDPKLAIEIGASVLMGKPIIAVDLGGGVPAGLVPWARWVVEMRPGESFDDDAFQSRLQDTIGEAMAEVDQ